DYRAYQITRDELLTTSRGIAALLEGGLVWRLAVAKRGGEVPVRDVLLFPEDDEHTEILAATESCRAHVVLTLQDHYVICGVYRILTASSSDASITSWWPLQETWNASAYNVGYWSNQAEEWFQKRWGEFANGTAKPKPNQVWKKEL
ncbi:hypothetical protein BDY19DRAFT_864797, partial [Irpex rosettiformis]